MHTQEQFADGSKDVTRRVGWRKLKVGEHLLGIEKGMGLKRGEKTVALGELVVLGVRFEPLNAIDKREVEREGFPDMTPAAFVEWFCRSMGCRPSDEITRIEFRRIEAVT